MSFSEKLLQLRKEKSYSQEALAEKLCTTRQAVSKWENGQGFPETEKLLMIGNLFEVSIDYLLKEGEVKGGVEEHGFYVSQEMAEGYLSHQQKSSNRIATGVCLLIMACLPYLMLRQEPVVYSFLIILLAAGGVVALVSAILKDEERYHVLGKEALMLDQVCVKQLTERLNRLKSRYAAMIIVSAGMVAVGGMAFLLENKGISEGALVPYYPVCVVLIAMGAYVIIRTSTLWSSYSLLIYNEKHINRRNDGFWRKIRKKLADKNA
ncbi:transcriptional regulator with XRE-family HTH domain [Paenibacillus anaericanus]|uniref:XRE family transcriptional regulator n=1 Tax=Paenibacillus anaericanus TaxID=170367 RepID=A0A3S1EFQ0_9BACL|nr:helix-turn-helix transcriptional regulator [Paenibacillus anaericanus]MDQ0090461.1 transcriptional regulator with XRE-family HTH domain [Paenibacillus anaericanus]RUT44648.1 XRE family transcriptional regulator [Paenibacillus anaericanus]